MIRLIHTAKNISLFNNSSSQYHQMAKNFLQENIADLNTYEQKCFSNRVILKMQWYMAECIWVAQTYANIFDRKLTQRELSLCLQSGALIAVNDYLLDDTTGEIRRARILKHPQPDLEPRNPIERFYLNLYKKFDQEIDKDQRETILSHYESMYEAQLASYEQLNPAVSQEKVDELCRQKCGTGMFFLRIILSESIEENEKETWFELGAFVQYCNDAQDLIKDVKKGINTFASTRDNFETIITDLDHQRKKTFEMIKSLDIPEKKKDHLLFTLHVMYVVILSKIRKLIQHTKSPLTIEDLKKIEPSSIDMKNLSANQLLFVLPLALSYRYEKAERKSFGYKDVVD